MALFIPSRTTTDAPDIEVDRFTAKRDSGLIVPPELKDEPGGVIFTHSTPGLMHTVAVERPPEEKARAEAWQRVFALVVAFEEGTFFDRRAIVEAFEECLDVHDPDL